MKTKKLLIYSAMILFVGLVITKFTSCDPDYGKKIEMKCLKEVYLENSQRPHVLITLENSMSMKGYVAKETKVEYPNMKFESVVGNLVSKLINEDFQTQWQCGAKKGCSTSDLFNKGIRNGSIFAGGDTPLEDYFREVGEKANDSVVSMFVSDMVFSMSTGKMKNNPEAIKNEIPKLQTLVEDALRPLVKKQIHLLLIQYTSDFNGKYYYNCTNNNTPCKFQREVMHKRPYYILAFGTQENLNALLSANVFPKYNKLWASFTLTDNDYMVQSATSIEEQYWYIDPAGYDTIPATFLPKADWEEQMTKVRFTFSPINGRAFLNSDWQPRSSSHAVSDPRKISDTEIEVQFIPYCDIDWRENVSISLIAKREDWKGCSVDSDLLPCEEIQNLEGKTWAFDKIMESLLSVYPNIVKEEIVGEISFDLLKE